MFDVTASAFDDPDFKEDSVREEIIVPILRRLGFKASEPYRIIRSKSLVHPYVMIGSKRHKIYIIPDYILSVDGHFGCVLDAKGPSERLVKAKHAEQAYSYAIHPDVRTRYYALCNGRQLLAYDVNCFSPVLDVTFEEITSRWDQIAALFSPENLAFVPRVHFQPDFGLAVVKSGASTDGNWLFHYVMLDQFSFVADGYFTSMTSVEVGDVAHALSFDFGQDIFDQLLALLPSHDRTRITSALITPGASALSATPIYARVVARIGNPTQVRDEEFVPFHVVRIDPVNPDEAEAIIDEFTK